MELYEKIQYYRKKNNLNQSDLADKLDVSRQTIYKWEQGITSPDIDKLPTLAGIFNTTVDELLSKEEISNKEDIKEIPETNSAQKRHRSMLDYLLMIPFGLTIGILIFMFYCFGAMLIGFLYAGFGVCAVAPFGSLFMMFKAHHVGQILIYISIIFAGAGLIYPLWVFALWYTKKYIYLAKKLAGKLKNINIRRIL